MIEILIGLVVSIIILGAVVTVMHTGRINYEMSISKSEMQENGRFAMHFLTEDLRNAGFLGCNNQLTAATTTDKVSITNGGGGATDSITILYGEPADAGITTTTDIPGSAALTDYSVTVAVPDSFCDSAPCDLGDVSGWDQATQAVISDCGGATIVNFNKTSDTTLEITSGTSLGRWIFDAGADIRRLVSATYTIATGASGAPSLWRSVGGAPAVEIVEGVENLQFLYQVDGSGQQAKPPWPQMQAVHVGLLARTVSHAKPGTGAGGQYGNDKDSGVHDILDATTAAGTVRGSRQTYASMVVRRNN